MARVKAIAIFIGQSRQCHKLGEYIWKQRKSDISTRNNTSLITGIAASQEETGAQGNIFNRNFKTGIWFVLNFEIIYTII